MISNKAKYAFRALLAIAAEPEGEALTSAEIARRHAIPHKFLEQILLDMKKAGILASRRGKSGNAVVDDAPDVAEQEVVVRGKLRQARNGRRHWKIGHEADLCGRVIE